MRIPRICPKSCNGFSLLQISIILMMAALVLTSMLPGQGAGDTNQKILDTINRLNKVEDGMQRFMAANGRRPCPADGVPDVNNANFGIEAATPGSCSGAPMGPTGNVVAGTIPTKTLGLPDDHAFDAWGRRFTYEVDTRATANASCYNLKTTNNTGGIQIVPTTVGSPAIDNVMVAYVSHGPSGYGAWPAQGSDLAHRINTGSTDKDKENNAGVAIDGSFTTNFTNTLVMKDKTSAFDDIVYTPDTTKNTCCTGKACNMSAGFQAQGAANDNAGNIVVTLDLNGDGIADTAICAPNANSGAGAVYVVFGTKSTTYSTPFPLASASNVIITGVKCTSLAAGDVNGDGIQDLLIGTSGYNSDTGAVYVIPGGTGAWPASFNVGLPGGSLGTRNSAVDTLYWRIEGENTNDKFGASIAAGDFNGDDYDDILVGAPGAPGANNGTNNGTNNDGVAYLIEGSSSAWPGISTITSHIGAGLPAGTCSTTSCVLKISSTPTKKEKFGIAVTMGDINGDGVTDLIIGAPGASPVVEGVTRSGAGSTYVIGGNTGSFTTPLFVGSLNGIPASPAACTPGSCGAAFSGTSSGDLSGTALDAGDINGDGVTDLIIGAPGASPVVGGVTRSGAGSTYVVFGKTTGFDQNPPLSGLAGFRVDGMAGDGSGKSVYGRCDTNGDGVQDLIIGAPGASPVVGGTTRSNAGSTYVVFGGTTSTSQVDATSGVSLYGAAANDNAGTSVSGGDFYNSGLCAPIIGAPGANGGTGVVHTLLGNRSWPSSLNLSTLR